MASTTTHTLTAVPTASVAAARLRVVGTTGWQRATGTGCTTGRETEPMFAVSYVSDHPAGNGFVAIPSHRPHGSLEPSP